MPITQQEYNVVKQNSRKLYSKFEILNCNFQNIGDLEGTVIGTPSFTNDSTSSIRRTCSLQITPTNSSFDIKQGNKLWINNYIKIYIGIVDIHTQDIIYTNMGIYLINNPSRVYNATNNTISISGMDLMAKLTGLRGGNLEGIEYVIPQESDVRKVLIDTLKQFNFNNYIIDEYPIKTPYQINVSIGGNGYNIIEELLNILPNWQAYFDVNGVFHFEEIPNGENEQIIVDDDLWKKVLIGYSRDYDYEDIKNYIEVLGGTHDNTIPCEFISYASNSNIYYLKCDSVKSSLKKSQVFSFTTNSQKSSITSKLYIVINNITKMEIRNEDGSVPQLEPNTYYVFQYIYGYYKFLSSLQPYGIAKETNPKSPFYINGDAKTLRIVLTDGDYTNITSDYLAQQRAEFELYQRCRLQDSVNITCVPIYWLDTNWLIKITLPNKQGEIETNEYLIKSINTNLGVNETQTINLMRYYPYYPSI